MAFKLISREGALEQNPALARYLYDWQSATFNPDDSLFYAGESVFLEMDDEEPTILSVQKARELNEENAYYCKSMIDHFREPPQDIQHVKTLIAELPVEDIGDYFVSMGAAVRNLADDMAGHVHMISMSVAPYLEQENDYPPVKNAIDKLLEAGLPKDYLGALELEGSHLSEFIEHMFWVTRCNASAPNIAFTLGDTPIVGILCKYGNIHFECFDNQIAVNLENTLKNLGFLIPENGRCEERLAPSNTMEGRRIDIS